MSIVTVTNPQGHQLVTVSVPGVQGPPGPAGPAGPQGTGGDLTYVHVQGSPASTWTVVHNLGKYPSVTVVDSANDQGLGGVHYDDENTCTLTFGAPFSGKAFAN